MRLRSKVSKRKLRSVGSKTCSPGALRYVLYSIRPTLPCSYSRLEDINAVSPRKSE